MYIFAEVVLLNLQLTQMFVVNLKYQYIFIIKGG